MNLVNYYESISICLEQNITLFVRANGEAPLSSNNMITSNCPLLAASNNGVKPSQLEPPPRSSILAPCSIKIRTASTCP